MTVQRVKLSELTEQRIQLLQEQFAGKDADVEISTPSASIQPSEMNEEKFWSIIGQFDWEKQGNDDAVIEPAVQHLAQLSDTAILTFYDLLSEKLYLLDGRTYADHSTAEKGRISSDLFLYARCCVVANGQALFETVMKNPAAFPKDLFFESLLDLPERAWFRKTGKPLEHLPKYIFETGFNPHGWGADTITL